jgi:hypothetical protein
MSNTQNLNEVTPKQRDSNLELMRIIAMLLIVAHHYVVNSGLTLPEGPIFADPMSKRSLFLLVFGAWGIMVKYFWTEKFSLKVFFATA